VWLDEQHSAPDSVIATVLTKIHHTLRRPRQTIQSHPHCVCDICPVQVLTFGLQHLCLVLQQAILNCDCAIDGHIERIEGTELTPTRAVWLEMSSAEDEET
jgi:hypothetical protein